MNKRGTHVEVIISFVIFITFVIFLFAASRPAITKQEDKKNLFDTIEYQLIEDISSDVKVVSLDLISSPGACFTIDKELAEFGIGRNIVVKNSTGHIVNAEISSGDLLTIHSGDNFFKVYYSQEIEELEDGSSCTSVTPEIGLTKTVKYISEKKTVNSLDDDYNNLRTRYDVAENMDFNYGIVLSNGTVIEKQNEGLRTNISTSIYSRDRLVEYVDLNGNINTGYLRLKIW